MSATSTINNEEKVVSEENIALAESYKNEGNQYLKSKFLLYHIYFAFINHSYLQICHNLDFIFD